MGPIPGVALSVVLLSLLIGPMAHGLPGEDGAWFDGPAIAAQRDGAELEGPVLAPPVRPRTHDWRAPGFVSVVDGQLYDPSCRRLRSVGSNVPNLLFRDELTETLQWMQAHQMRWMRVFATGHGAGVRGPRSVAEASAALRALLSRVEVFNAQNPPSQSIYVLVALTDYYQPGVPGDRYAYDNPHWGEQPVLPALWFRPGVQEFEFEQEHGLPRLSAMPNYEVNYLPWVRLLVAGAAGSPALLGWQLGNELKARSSAQNGVDAALAYQWYLDFTRVVVDTIREVDQQHLIFQGVQYMGEATDWGYRVDGVPDPELATAYRRLVDRMLAACDKFCWNVWSLTRYDFSPYPLDDAAIFGEQKVAAVVTEYGFTRGAFFDMLARFGGDRVAATRWGLARRWVDIYGEPHPRHWGAVEMVERASLAGVAPWGSPAPGLPGIGFDADLDRGITATPDEVGLWAAWREVGAALEARNRQAGVSAACLAIDSRRAPMVP